jgi:uncharacterized membrane protein
MKARQAILCSGVPALVVAVLPLATAALHAHERHQRRRAAALTFQLGSDIASTTVAPGWDELGRLAAVAVIRTFLTFFLDRDLDKARDEQQAQGEPKQALRGVP